MLVFGEHAELRQEMPAVTVRARTTCSTSASSLGAGRVTGGGVACLLRLFDELGQQRLVVVRLMQYVGYRRSAVGLDDLGIRSRTSFR